MLWAWPPSHSRHQNNSEHVQAELNWSRSPDKHQESAGPVAAPVKYTWSISTDLPLMSLPRVTPVNYTSDAHNPLDLLATNWEQNHAFRWIRSNSSIHLIRPNSLYSLLRINKQGIVASEWNICCDLIKLSWEFLCVPYEQQFCLYQSTKDT